MKAIFIDVDNTLLDFDLYTKNTLIEGFKHFSLPEFQDEMLETFHKVNNAIWHELELGNITLADLQKKRFQIYFDALNIKFDGIIFEKYYRENLFNSAIVIDGAYDMLEYLSKKYILCIASNGPYNQQINRLKLANMDKYFKYYFISEKIGCSKPSKEFFEESFKELNLKNDICPKETCIIGDSLSSDIKGGKNYNMKTCFFNKKGIDVKDIQSDYIIDNLIDTLKIF